MYKVYYPLKGASNQKSSEIMDPSRSAARIYDAKLSSALNSSATLTFTIDQSNPMYSQIEMRGDRWVYVYWDDTMLFKGFIVDTIRNADLTLTVTAKDAIYDMDNVKFRFWSHEWYKSYYESIDYVLYVMTAFSEISLTDYPVRVPMPFNAGRPETRHSTKYVVDVKQPKEASTVYDYMRPLIEQYGCFMVMRDGEICVSTKPLQDTDVTMRLGETIRDIKVEVNEQDFPTAVYAIGGNKYPVTKWSDMYDDHRAHFRLAKDKKIGTEWLSVTFDRSINNYWLESTFIIDGKTIPNTSYVEYSYIVIDFHPKRTNTWKNYVGYGRVGIKDGYQRIEDGQTVEISVPALYDVEIKKSDNVDIMFNLSENANELGDICLPREAGAAGPYIASDDNPIETTYEGVRLWVDYNTIIMRDLAEQYGVRTIDFEDNTIKSPDTLFDKAFTELVKNAVVGTRVTVDAIDPAIIDGTGTHLRPGDSVNVESEQHGLTGRMVLSGMELDLNTPANNRYSLGNLATTVTDKIALLNAKIASVRNLAKG